MHGEEEGIFKPYTESDDCEEFPTPAGWINFPELTYRKNSIVIINYTKRCTADTI